MKFSIELVFSLVTWLLVLGVFGKENQIDINCATGTTITQGWSNSMQNDFVFES